MNYIEIAKAIAHFKEVKICGNIHYITIKNLC